MRKTCLPVLLLVLINLSAFAEPNDKSGHSFALGVSFGMLSGETEEIVYVDSASDDKLSMLNWEIKPLFYAGLDLHYGWQSSRTVLGLFSDIFFKFGIPAKTGTMGDRDWFDSNWDGTYPWLTHYSEHENKTNTAVLLDFNVGVSFKLSSGFKLKPFLSYSFMFYSWEASGGSYLYPLWFHPQEHFSTPSSERVITYKQSWHIVSPGFSFYGEFNRFFNLELSVRISPFILLISVDDHIGTNTVYTDLPFGGFFIEPGLLFSFKADAVVTLSFSYAFRYITGSRGDSMSKTGGISFITDNIAGASYSVHDIGITAKFTVPDF